MLTKLTLRNFKRFEDAEIELGDSVVLIGPNNSGKTTALQALTLWETGLRRWLSKRKRTSRADERQGVAVNRRDLVAVPVPSGRLLWRDLAVRSISKQNGEQTTKYVHLGIIVEGITQGKQWACGLEFDYTNEESFYVRPLRTDEDGSVRMSVPEEATHVRTAFLPPMSGLASDEYLKQPGEISVLVGQGQTAQVLRNLCYRVCYPGGDEAEPSASWRRIEMEIRRLFGAGLRPPQFIRDRGQIRMSYEDHAGAGPTLDLSAAGRGLQQILLLLAYIYSNPEAVLLLDEPDAHLEVLRQRQSYQLIHAIAAEQGAQIIAASHSEIVLNEAARTGTVVAFVGRPHVLTGQSSQVLKALTTLGWEQYYQAEVRGWVLYVEDATDLAILIAFAELLRHDVRPHLEACFVHYVSTNLPQLARDHFYGLQEAKPDLKGIALFDRLDKEPARSTALVETMWRRREIENYLTTEQALLHWATPAQPTDLFSAGDSAKSEADMRQAIDRVTDLLSIDEKDPWSPDTKASDEVLDRVFREFFRLQGLPVRFRKADYHGLVKFLNPEEVDPEVAEKLDAILSAARQASPRQ